MRIKNKHTNEVMMEQISGFNIGILFLGWIWALVKGNTTKALLLFLLAGVTCGIFTIVQSFTFNEDNWKRLQALGWEIDSEQ